MARFVLVSPSSFERGNILWRRGEVMDCEEGLRKGLLENRWIDIVPEFFFFFRAEG